MPVPTLAAHILDPGHAPVSQDSIHIVQSIQDSPGLAKNPDLNTFV